ncbi:MAG: hypothetical protein F6K03_06430 [Kamptonema sp. SIO4C4]|nr:hypothetical protein [Kamptonema sp. SIO4C4]
MSALPIPDFQLNSPEDLAELLRDVQTWQEVEALTTAYAHWKVKAWELLSEEEKERLQTLKQWKDYAIAQKFPPGCTVQRLNDTQGLTGQVIKYWQAYGVDYITFQVGDDIDWCRASNLKKMGNGHC